MVKVLLWQNEKALTWPMEPTFLPRQVAPWASAASSTTQSLWRRAMRMMAVMSHTLP